MARNGNPRVLPDPIVAARDAACLGCGYSMEGLDQRTVCPECGTVWADRQLVMWGVPTLKSVTTRGRRIAIVVVVVIGMFWVQVLFFSVALFGARLTLSALLVLIVGMVWLLATSRGKGGEKSRIVVMPGRIAVQPMRRPKPGETWMSTVIRLEPGGRGGVRRVSAHWARVRVVDAAGREIFAAGVRMPMAMTAAVHGALQDAIGGRAIGLPISAGAEAATSGDGAASPGGERTSGGE